VLTAPNEDEPEETEIALRDLAAGNRRGTHLGDAGDQHLAEGDPLFLDRRAGLDHLEHFVGPL